MSGLECYEGERTVRVAYIAERESRASEIVHLGNGTGDATLIAAPLGGMHVDPSARADWPAGRLLDRSVDGKWHPPRCSWLIPDSSAVSDCSVHTYVQQQECMAALQARDTLVPIPSHGSI